jgi:hypothetical protein
MSASTPYPLPETSRPRRRLASAVDQLQGDRVLGIVGGVTIGVATGLSWYSRQLSIALGRTVESFTSPITLWHVRGFGASMLILGAVVGVACLMLVPVRERRGGIVSAIAGFGIALFSVVSMFDLPDLPSAAIVGAHAGAALGTGVDVGPFVALVGGVMLLIGGLTASKDAATVAARGQR